MSNNTTRRLLESCGIREPMAQESRSPFAFHLLNKADFLPPSVFRTICARLSEQTRTPSFSLFNKVLIALFFIATFSVNSYATHDRGGSLTWQQAGGNTIKFTLNTSWRRSYYSPLPVVGSTVALAGGLATQFNFGDGTSVNAINATVTSIDAVEDVITTTWTVSHTYSLVRSYTASFENCCRLSTLTDGNNDTNFRFETTVSVGPPYWNPAVSSLPPVVNLSVGQSAATFRVPAQAKDNQVVEFRASTTAESGLVKPVPTGFSITSSGVVTFNTIGLHSGDLYSVQIMMESVDPTKTPRTVNSKVPVDFIIEIVDPSVPPVFASPISNTSINLLPGQAVNLSVAARDPDVGQFVTLNPVAIPLGSTMSPTLPVSGPVNGYAVSTFSWTPSASQVGTYVITFVAADNVGVQTLTSITINVLCSLNTTVSNTTSTSCPSSSDGAAQITIQNFTSAANLLYIWTGPNSFSASTQNISGVRAGSYSVKVIDNANGCNVTKPVTIGAIPDITKPIITCPANIPCVEATDPKGAVINLPSATASDNCSTVNVTSSIASGTFFGVGTNTVVYTATDASNNMATCSFTVDICDTSPPTIENTPADIPCVEATSPAGAVVTYTNPTATDIVDGAVAVTCVPASGSTFPIGINTVVATATDAHGNSASTSFTVTVCDNTPPVVSCPADIPCVERTSLIGAVVNYPTITATDIVDGDVAVQSYLPINGTYIPPTGSLFIMGLNTVRVTATDAHGNASSCSFTVKVCDTRPPVVTCPADIPCVEATSPAGAVVTFPDNSVGIDYMGDDVQTYTALSDIRSGSTFPIGVNTVTMSATDNAGNTGSCSFMIEVCDRTPPVIHNTPANIPCVEATSPAGAVVTYTNPTATDIVDGAVSVVSVPASGSTFPLGTSTVVSTAKDALGNSSSTSFTVTVCDKTPPVIYNTPANIPCVEATSPAGAVVTYANPTATDIVDGVVAVTTLPASGSTFSLGTTTVVSTATDAHGNSASTSFTVTVCDRTPPVVSCPANIPCTEATSPAGAVVTYPSVTATDIVDGAVTAYSVLPSGSTFFIGVNTIVATATDVHGNSGSCSFTIQVCDTRPPVITCPANITVGATSPAGAVVTYPSSTATDIVDGNVPTTSVLPSGSTFPIGISTVISTAFDAQGNSATCSFTVRVINTPPIITCPTNIPCVEATSAAGAVVTFPSATAIDYKGASIATTSTPASGSVFSIGTTTVTATATDELVLSSSCSFTVKVCDNTPPAITCPTPLSISTDAGVCGAKAIFTVTAFDIVTTAPTITKISGLGSGATYPVGTSTNVYSAVDAAGNSSSCSFTVKVTDTEKPSITAPANITVCAGSTVTLGTPTRSDNCGVQSVTNNAPSAYPSGTTTVIWTVTDVNGNKATATQTVTIPVIAIGTPSVTNVKCYGGSDGKVVIAATGGTNTFTYKRSGSATTNTIGIFTGLAAGTYTFTATDGNGCTATISATVGQNPPVTVNAGNCQFVYYGYGSNCATLTATASGGTGVFTYAWSAGSASGSSTQVCATTTTTYTVTATDQNGCSATNTLKVEVIDVRCGNKNDKVSICHNGNVLCVAPSAIPAHLAHGDNLGACGATSPCGSLNSIANHSNGASTSIHTKEGEIGMTVYPNPAQNKVNVTLENMTEGDATILILDITGKVMSNTQQPLSEGYNALILNVANLSSGLYYIKVQLQSEQPMVRKLQIMQ